MLHFQRVRLSVLFSLVMVALSACGGGGGGSTTDTAPPTVQITYPSANSYTDGLTVNVRGKAADNAGIQGVSVNGVDAVSTDNFATWTATVSLQAGSNTLSAIATDTSGNQSTIKPSVNIDAQTNAVQNIKFTYDNLLQKMLSVDNVNGTLSAINLADASQSVLSSATYPDSNNVISNLNAMSADSLVNHLYVADRATKDRLLDIDLTTGVRNVITADVAIIPTNELLAPSMIQIDPVGKVAYVFDATSPSNGTRSILRYDLTTGTPTLLTSTSPNYLTSLTWPDSMALDTAHNRLLICDTFYRVIVAIDLTSGARTVFATLTNTSYGLVVDTVHNQALVIDNTAPGALNGYDLDTGVKTTISSDLTGMTIAGTFALNDMAVDNANNRVLYAGYYGAIYSISLSTGAVSTLSDSTTPNATNPLYSTAGIVIDATNNRALVTMVQRNVYPNLASVIAVDLTTGARKIVSSPSVPDNLTLMQNPAGIGLDTTNNRALVTDYGLQALVAVDLTTGSRTIVSDNTMPDANKTFYQIKSIVADSANNRLLALDTDRQTIFGVDVTSGNRTIVSNNAVPDRTNPFKHPLDMVLNGTEAFVMDDYQTSIFRVNLVDGSRTLFSTASIPDANNPFTVLVHMVLDSAHARLLVLDGNYSLPRRIIAVDIATGARTILSSDTIPNTDASFQGFSDISIDVANNRALVTDTAINRIIAVDLDTGARTPVYGGYPNSSIPLYMPNSVVFDAKNHRALIASGGGTVYDSIVSFDMNTHTGTVITDKFKPNTVNPIANPRDLVLDTVNNRVLVINANALYSVDLTSGARIMLSSGYTNLQKMALDRANNRVIVTDQTDLAVYAIDLAKGTKTVISNNSVPDAVNPFGYVTGIALDSAHNRALVLDVDIVDSTNNTYSSGVVAVDLTSGARTVLASGAVTNSKIGFNNPTAISIDTAHNRALITNYWGNIANTVIAVDLTSGATSPVSEIKTYYVLDNMSSPEGITVLPGGDQALVADAITGLVHVDLVTGERTVLYH